MRVATVTLGLLLGASGLALAAEPWVAPEVAKPCPHYGPGWIAVQGSSTCVRIGGRVVADFTAGGKAGPEVRREMPRGFGTGARVTLESRTETELGPLHLIYRMDAGKSRIPGR
nr:porin [Enterovirga sp. DB1703]